MDPNTLRERLAKLHADLTEAQKENPAAKKSLDEILPEVKRLVDQPVAAPARDRSLPDRLERVAVRFEAEHPTIAASARQLIDLLSEVGI
jgi:signal transduction histidine kinase